MIYRNAYLTINGVNLSAFVSSAEPSFDVELQDDTVMGDVARSNAPGLTDWTMSVQFKNPFAASGPDATIGPLVGAAPFAVAWRPDAGAIATTNPEYQMTAVVASWNPVAGNVGDEGVASLELRNGTGSAVVRDVTP